MDVTAYQSLSEAHGGEQRWAFGTGFDDPLAGVDTTVPPEVDAPALAAECLDLGDDALVLAQQLAGWCSHAPELEVEMALANIALDLLGQARLLLSRAATADRRVVPERAPSHIPDEDALAYFREPDEFRSVRFVEGADGGDFAVALLRLVVAVTWRRETMRALSGSADPVVAAIAAKAMPELTYHCDYAAGWVVVLGNGTVESRERLAAAHEQLDVSELADADGPAWAAAAAVLHPVFAEAGLAVPEAARLPTGTGLRRAHVATFAALIEPMQRVARADPEAIW